MVYRSYKKYLVLLTITMIYYINSKILLSWPQSSLLVFLLLRSEVVAPLLSLSLIAYSWRVEKISSAK